MAGQHDVPEDFPKQPSSGAVSGAQPKLLVRRVDGRYQSALTEEQLRTRYDACEDLVRQLVEYALRKIGQFGWSIDEVLEKVKESLSHKVSAGEWDLSPEEIGWVMERSRRLLSTIASQP